MQHAIDRLEHDYDTTLVKDKMTYNDFELIGRLYFSDLKNRVGNVWRRIRQKK